ncbi:YceH family protein [Stieleria varia]|uniref:Uncharacterized protein n=1 Tax=Stieleria varia TaxID=2528005 RepID=A0A5C5ZRS5_9BACT|nr:YceH family protein [Stieleria varia]TWT89491.1 hypothetical protein Pla52n_67790 [Stieleria varia]
MSEESDPKPSPISDKAQRVLGVLVEKAKTTPDNYPLSLAGLVSGCNQKSNRSPVMDLDEDDVLLALDELRERGAAREVQGNGRVTKYRHAAYEWLGVDSPGAAIMTELLLRGPQTIGELRTRASRMYKLDDLETTKQVLKELEDKQLVESLSPPGRGQTFAHKLYTTQDRLYLDARMAKQAAASESDAGSTATAQPRSAVPSESKSAVDQLIARLDKVTERIDDLEARLKALES